MHMGRRRKTLVRLCVCLAWAEASCETSFNSSDWVVAMRTVMEAVSGHVPLEVPVEVSKHIPKEILPVDLQHMLCLAGMCNVIKK